MDLLNRILNKENLIAAYEQVVRNKGSAGVDGIRIDDLKPHLQEHWDRLKEELKAGIYQPLAILGVKIPKRNGGERLLGIPTTLDRMIQQAIHQELSPLFDPEFSEHSYGFRPGKSATQAIQQALTYINQGNRYIVDIDLKSFFDEVNHDCLMNLIKRRVHLVINEKKSAIRRPLNYKYLGFAFESSFQKGVRDQYQLVVSKSNWVELKYKIKQITPKTIPVSFDERVKRLNLLMRGWLNYFKPANIFGKLRTMDGWVRNRLRYCIWHHWKRPRRRATNLARLGVPGDMAWKWAYSRMGGWAVSCSPILITTITVDRLKRRGYISFVEYYLDNR